MYVCMLRGAFCTCPSWLRPGQSFQIFRSLQQTKAAANQNFTSGDSLQCEYVSLSAFVCMTAHHLLGNYRLNNIQQRYKLVSILWYRKHLLTVVHQSRVRVRVRVRVWGKWGGVFCYGGVYSIRIVINFHRFNARRVAFSHRLSSVNIVVCHW